MKYDFAHPKFRNGMVTFDEKKPDLLRIFREQAFRKRCTLRPDMYLYNQGGDRLAKVENYGHVLLVYDLTDGHKRRSCTRLGSMMEIHRYFMNMDEHTESRGNNTMKLHEAKLFLRQKGYRLIRENKEKTYRDYIEELRSISPELADKLDDEKYREAVDIAVQNGEILEDDAGYYYSPDVGRDSMTDDPSQLFDIDDIFTYDDLVNDFGTPEEYAANA